MKNFSLKEISKLASRLVEYESDYDTSIRIQHTFEKSIKGKNELTATRKVTFTDIEMNLIYSLKSNLENAHNKELVWLH